MTCSNCVKTKQPDEYSLSVCLFVSLSVRLFVCSSKIDKFV